MLWEPFYVAAQAAPVEVPFAQYGAIGIVLGMALAAIVVIWKRGNTQEDLRYKDSKEEKAAMVTAIQEVSGVIRHMSEANAKEFESLREQIRTLERDQRERRERTK